MAGSPKGMQSVWFPVLVVCAGMITAFGFACGWNLNDISYFSLGLYGVGIAAVGMLSTLGITLATDAYGPIADNAGGNAEMSHLDPIVRERTDALDSLGNTTAATGKGFAIGSAALTALALLAAYVEEVRVGFERWGETAAEDPGGRDLQAVPRICGRQARRSFPQLPGAADRTGAMRRWRRPGSALDIRRDRQLVPAEPDGGTGARRAGLRGDRRMN